MRRNLILFILILSLVIVFQNIDLIAADISAGFTRTYPNPFNPDSAGRSSGTVIEYRLTERTPVDLVIYDIKGRIIMDLCHAFQEEGDHYAVWNGTDNYKRPVPSGIYFYRLRTKESSDTRKIVLMR